MKNILVPCDFSEPSRAAYKTAVHWASKNDGEVFVLHAIATPTAYIGYGSEAIEIGPNYFTNIEDRAKDQFRKMKLEINLPSVPSRLDFAYGEVVSSIRDSIHSQNIDMIIMGTSGSSGVAEIFIGSNTEKVVRNSTVPVLAVKEYVNISAIKKILIPTLFNLDQTEFMKKLIALQQFLDATLHILRVNTPINFLSDSDSKGLFNEFVKQYKLQNYVYHSCNYKHEEQGIIDFTVSQKMDLLAMATHARKGLAHLFNGSLTEDLVNHINCPVWTCTIKKQS